MLDFARFQTLTSNFYLQLYTSSKSQGVVAVGSY